MTPTKAMTVALGLAVRAFTRVPAGTVKDGNHLITLSFAGDHPASFAGDHQAWTVLVCPT
ncbi:hypothetical protein [Arthrobacter sp. 754]|uniref:hypothetical protein n=1 Tax=Arthrobacter sp. 754 TaxID=3156315 RepID=UPI00339AC235